MKTSDEDSSSPKTFIIVKTEINRQYEYYRHVDMGPLGVHALFSICFAPIEFSDGVFSEVYERAVMRTILVAKVIDRAGPLPMYSATMLCCTNQTKLAEGLLLGEWPAHVVNGPRMAAQGPICKSCTHKGAGRKLPPLPSYI